MVAKVNCFWVLKSGLLKRKILERETLISKIMLKYKETGFEPWECPSSEFQEMVRGNPFGDVAPYIEFLERRMPMLLVVLPHLRFSIGEWMTWALVSGPNSGLSWDKFHLCLICYRGESFQVHIKQLNFSLQDSSDIGERDELQGNENADSNLGNQLAVLSDAESWKGRNIGNVSLEGCSHILKEAGRAEILVRIDHLVIVTESIPIYR